jgi:hypothetical protein
MVRAYIHAASSEQAVNDDLPSNFLPFSISTAERTRRDGGRWVLLQSLSLSLSP